ncbi:CidA/LrgA family protein [Bacillus sp. V3B]|uniref:CidA/LrgA family protein n=1 Tax=Bacillus sp. V3B TaxID=2804915 RepID=UPI00210A94F1|nr:CidA/LrgA family protein [Bacillus sp. V3B]MCQ6276981.1 CidA/LrgA family protein [Bacillus sp. V3B]
MKKALLFFAQLFVIWAIYTLSDFIVSFLHLPVPASVFGMVLLYLLLVSGILQVRYIERAAAFLNKHLAFFFIPFAVGLMNYGGLIQSSGLQLLIMIGGSSIVGLLITSGLTQYLSRREETKRERSNSH